MYLYTFKNTVLLSTSEILMEIINIKNNQDISSNDINNTFSKLNLISQTIANDDHNSL